MPLKELIRYFPIPEKNSAQAPLSCEPPFYVRMAGISYYDKTYAISRRNSPFYNCEFIVDGEGEVYCDGIRHEVSKGDVYILPSGFDHNYKSSQENPWMKMFFCVSGRLTETLVREYEITSLRVVHEPGLYNLFVDFFNVAFNKKIPLETLNQKAALLFHEFAQKLAEKAPSHIRNESHLLKEFIEQNVQRNITLHDMAEHIYRSPSQTIRLFRKEFGITPYDYYIKKRIELACTILRSRNIPIKSVSELLGFTDENYFSKVFRKHMQTSPGKYKNNATK